MFQAHDYFCLLCTLCFSSSAVNLLCGGKRKTSKFSGPRILQSFPQEGPEPQINTSTWPSVRVPERAVSALLVTYRIPWDISRLFFLQCGLTIWGSPFVQFLGIFTCSGLRSIKLDHKVVGCQGNFFITFTKLHDYYQVLNFCMKEKSQGAFS